MHLLVVSSLSWNAPLVNLNRPAMRASTPVMETFEEYKARVLEKPADGPPTIAGVAAVRGSVKATKVSSPGTSSRPTRADSRAAAPWGDAPRVVRPPLAPGHHGGTSHAAVLFEDSPPERPERPPRKHLPSRRVLCPQVHHNPWEALQHMKWGDALNRVDKRLAYMSPAERMSTRVWQQRGRTIPLFILAAALLREADLIFFCFATQSFRSTCVSAPTRRSPSWALPSLTAASPNGTRPTVTVASSTSRPRSRTSARRRGAATRVPRRTASWTGSR